MCIRDRYYYIIMTVGTLFEPLSVKALHALHINREGKLWHAFQVLRTLSLIHI